jgi:Uncharacterized protein conserved in bacteria
MLRSARAPYAKENFMLLPILIAVAVGCLMPAQTTINARMGRAVKSPLAGTLIAFVIGAAFLALLALVSGARLLPPAGSPWWMWIGGVLGTVSITLVIVIFPHVGAVETVILPVVGKTITALAVDNFGWFSSTQQSMTWQRGFGAVLVGVGTVVAVANRDSFAGRKVGIQWRLLGIVSGIIAAVQAALNGAIAKAQAASAAASGTSAAPTFQSFISPAFLTYGIGALVLLVLVLAVRQFPTRVESVPWWAWFGGVVGAGFVLGMAYLVPTLGTGVALTVALVGQIIGSFAIDQFGWFNAPRNTVTWIKLGGVLLVGAGAALFQLF